MWGLGPVIIAEVLTSSKSLKIVKETFSMGKKWNFVAMDGR